MNYKEEKTNKYVVGLCFSITHYALRKRHILEMFSKKHVNIHILLAFGPHMQSSCDTWQELFQARYTHNLRLTSLAVGTQSLAMTSKFDGLRLDFVQRINLCRKMSEI